MRYLLIFTIIIFSSITVFAQSNFDYIESLNVNDLNVKECTIKDFIDAFGEPDKVANEYSELDGVIVVKLTYGNSYFDFENNFLTEFSIKDEKFSLNPFSLTINKTSLDQMEKLFPKSFKEREVYDDEAVVRIILTDYYHVVFSFDRNDLLWDIYSSYY